jgi:hypothetical protein
MSVTRGHWALSLRFVGPCGELMQPDRQMLFEPHNFRRTNFVCPESLVMS